LFNGAQRLLKDRKLSQAELTGNTREPARILNDIWGDEALEECLMEGQWVFAKRTIQALASTDFTAPFGLKYSFEKPDDWIRTIGVWRDDGLRDPFRDYREEAGFWFGSIDTMYVSYVSNDADYGGDMSLWPSNFTHFVEAHLASRAAGPLTEKGQEMYQVRDMMLKRAQATDAMSDPTREFPVSSWVRARLGSTRWGTGRNE
jgi:hypothetical protein